MRHQGRWLLGCLFLCAIFAMTSKTIRAQGFSYSEWIDGNDNIDDELEAYFDGGESCVGSTVSATLNGQTIDLGEDGEVIQVVNPTTAGVTYVWSISYNITVRGPFGGCYDVQGSITVDESERITSYWQPTENKPSNGDWTCVYTVPDSLNCPEPDVATCNISITQPAPPNGAPCPHFIQAGWLATSVDGESTTCSGPQWVVVETGFPLQPPAYCD